MLEIGNWLKAQPCRFIIEIGPYTTRGTYEVSIIDVEVYNDEIIVNLSELRTVPELVK